MKCPKCEEGALTNIKFKTTGKAALFCNFCDALWFDNERVLATNGHTIRVLAEDEGIIDLDTQDHDHRPIQPIKHL